MKDRECNIYINTYKCPMKDCEGCRYRYVEKKPEFEQTLKDERNKTIDEFAKRLLNNEVIDRSVVRRVAEQMKGE